MNHSSVINMVPKNSRIERAHPTVSLSLSLSQYRFSWRRQWQPTPVLSPGKFHGWRSLVAYSPWSRKESDTTERLYFHFQCRKMTSHYCFNVHFSDVYRTEYHFYAF